MDATVTDSYDAHGIAFFRLSCELNAQDKKEFAPPTKWTVLPPTDRTMRRAGNAVGIRGGRIEPRLTAGVIERIERMRR